MLNCKIFVKQKKDRHKGGPTYYYMFNFQK